MRRNTSGPGPEQEMVGIGEQDLRARILERLRQLRLYRGLRADRHEQQASAPHCAKCETSLRARANL